MIDYLVIYEQGKDGGRGAYAPDLPGLGVVAQTREEVAQLIRKGLELHIAGLREDGLPIPAPTTTAERIAVAAGSTQSSGNGNFCQPPLAANSLIPKTIKLA